MARRSRFTRRSKTRAEYKWKRMPWIVKQAMIRSLREQAEYINDLQRPAVQEDTGDLKSSIGWRPTRGVKGSHGLAITIFAKRRHARYVEFGTNPHPDGNIYGSQAYPFFFPPYRMNRKKIRNRITRAQRRAIKRFLASA